MVRTARLRLVRVLTYGRGAAEQAALSLWYVQYGGSGTRPRRKESRRAAASAPRELAMRNRAASRRRESARQAERRETCPRHGEEIMR
eukprot:scaffold66963_cov61-Phaeocystis_antarctica.AAC.3